MRPLINRKYLEHYLWFMLWFLLPLSIKFSSMALVFLAFTVLIKFLLTPHSINRKYLFVFALFIAYFIYYLVCLLPDYTDFLGFWREAEKKLAFVAIPLIYLLSKLKSNEIRKYSSRGLVLTLLVSGALLLGKFLYLLPNNELEALVYHNFTDPLKLGAIYYSLLIFAAIFMLLDERVDLVLKKYRAYLIPYFLVLLMLSASKLFVLATLVFLIWHFIKHNKLETKRKRWLALASLLVFILLLFPVSKRFGELKNTDLQLVKQNTYTDTTHFNGLTLRLVQWKFASQIVQEHHAHFFGVGINNKQHLLNQKYIKSGMYTGNPNTEDRGFLRYNFHNQFMENYVGMGIIGVIFMIFIIFNAFVRNQFFSLPLYLILILFFITESVLDRQVGIVFFVLIYSSYLNESTTEISK